MIITQKSKNIMKFTLLMVVSIFIIFLLSIYSGSNYVEIGMMLIAILYVLLFGPTIAVAHILSCSIDDFKYQIKLNYKNFKLQHEGKYILNVIWYSILIFLAVIFRICDVIITNIYYSIKSSIEDSRIREEQNRIERNRLRKIYNENLAAGRGIADALHQSDSNYYAMKKREREIEQQRKQTDRNFRNMFLFTPQKKGKSKW